MGSRVSEGVVVGVEVDVVGEIDEAGIGEGRLAESGGKRRLVTRARGGITSGKMMMMKLFAQIHA